MSPTRPCQEDRNPKENTENTAGVAQYVDRIAAGGAPVIKSTPEQGSGGAGNVIGVFLAGGLAGFLALTKKASKDGTSRPTIGDHKMPVVCTGVG
eukprot:145346-Pyramimonas_sp.AAC.1